MAKFIAQRIHHGKKLGHPVEFEAVADPSRRLHTDAEAAYHEAYDGIDPFGGVWIDIKPYPEDKNG